MISDLSPIYRQTKKVRSKPLTHDHTRNYRKSTRRKNVENQVFPIALRSQITERPSEVKNVENQAFPI